MTDWYKIKRVLIWQNGQEKQVRPAGWHPWANTIAYYPLTSTSTVNDLSWNNYNLTQSWTITYWTNVWVDCAYFNWGYLSATIAWLPQWGTDRTASVYVYITKTQCWILSWWANSTYNKFCRYYWGFNSNWLAATSYQWTDLNSSTYISGWWHHIVLLVRSWVRELYIDWVQNTTLNKSSTTNTSWTNFEMWRLDYASDFMFQSYMSNVIIENKARTAQEISDYYNLTKWNYWL